MHETKADYPSATASQTPILDEGVFIDAGTRSAGRGSGHYLTCSGTQTAARESAWCSGYGSWFWAADRGFAG